MMFGSFWVVQCFDIFNSSSCLERPPIWIIFGSDWNISNGGPISLDVPLFGSYHIGSSISLVFAGWSLNPIFIRAQVNGKRRRHGETTGQVTQKVAGSFDISWWMDMVLFQKDIECALHMYIYIHTCVCACTCHTYHTHHFR